MQALRNTTIALSVLLALQGCGGGSDGSSPSAGDTMTESRGDTTSSETDTPRDPSAPAASTSDGSATEPTSPAAETTPSTAPLAFDSPDTVTVQECFQYDVVTLHATGGAGTLSYDLFDGDIDYFDVDTTSGAVRFKVPADYETKNSYTFTAVVRDGAGHSATQTVTVHISRWSTTHNGTEYGCVASPYTGKVWLDRNLGAARVCETLDDDACYGDYYQWGRGFDGHQDPTSPTVASPYVTTYTRTGNTFVLKSILSPDDWTVIDNSGSGRRQLWTTGNGSSVCPGGFRVPSIAELRAETFDQGMNNITDTFNSFLKLGAAGRRYATNGTLNMRGTEVNLWASDPAPGHTASMLYVTGSYINMLELPRIEGYSVRCIQY